MQAPNDLWLFFAMVFCVILLPGMDMAFVASSARTRGLRGGLVGVAGIIAAGVLHTIVGATGVAALLLLWPAAFNALLVAGALYMVWVGVSILRSTDAEPSASAAAPPRGAIFRRAVLTCLLNPKAYAFMLAVFPAFLRSTTYSMPVQTQRLGAVIAVTQLLVYGAVALFVASAKQWTGAGPNGQRAAVRAVSAALIGGAALTLAFAWQPAHAQPTENPTMTTSASHSSLSDFDFFIGSWRVAHRRLKERLAGSYEWVEFAGTTVAQKTLGGLGNMDDNVLELPGGTYRAVTLRSFDTGSQQWSIWWLDGRDPGKIDAPMVGQFRDGVGTFYADDTFAGRPVRVRFLWSLPRPDHPRWEQAFSTDWGATWETNWVMDFTRSG